MLWSCGQGEAVKASIVHTAACPQPTRAPARQRPGIADNPAAVTAALTHKRERSSALPSRRLMSGVEDGRPRSMKQFAVGPGRPHRARHACSFLFEQLCVFRGNVIGPWDCFEHLAAFGTHDAANTVLQHNRGTHDVAMCPTTGDAAACERSTRGRSTLRAVRRLPRGSHLDDERFVFVREALDHRVVEVQ